MSEAGETKYIALYLDGPMQAWGYQSRFDRRTTLAYPTKSGIIGLLCAALGVEKDNLDMLKKLNALSIEVLAFSRPFRWIDFHTVGAGYDNKVERLSIPSIAESGKPKKDPVVTHREFLADARFGAILSGDDALIERCASALQNPRWGIWLGRKCCVPASPVFQGTFENQKDALQKLSTLDRWRHPSRGVLTRRVRTVPRFEDRTDTLQDVPLNFGKREFAIRWISDEPLQEEM